MNEARDLSPNASRIVATHAAVAGLCPLIPVPFLDDMAARRVERRMFKALYAAHGRELSDAGAKVLSAGLVWGRGTAASLALYPVTKIVRKIAIVLAFKDCADLASRVYHDGWLMGRVLEDSQSIAGARSPTDPTVLRRIRKAMLRTYRDVDPAPLRRALVGSFRGARVGVVHATQAVQRLLHGARPAGDDAPPAEVADLTTRMRAAAMGEWQYLEKLERQFRRNLGLPDARPAEESRPSA